MRVDTRIVLKNYEGEDLTYPAKIKGKDVNLPLTIKDAIVAAINQPYPQEVKTADMIAKITGLSVKMYQNDDVNFTDDDRVFVKDRVLMSVQYGMWQPVVLLRIEELFSEKDLSTPVTPENAQPN